VDLVIERGDRIVAVEVKSSTTLTHRDLGGIKALQGDAGARFALGIVAYLGEEVRVLGERLLAVPLTSLLGAGPPSG
jgi:Holliday junction resolvase-like predicted endonuclease